MRKRKKRKFPVNSSRKNTCGVTAAGVPIPETDIRDLLRQGLIEQVAMSEEQEATVKRIMKNVKSI